jgi:hypothetical protein
LAARQILRLETTDPETRATGEPQPERTNAEIACAPGKLARSSRWKTGAGKP